MVVNSYQIEDFFPSYLSSGEKGRIKKGLEQFSSQNRSNVSNGIDYSGFYLYNSPNYLLQSDIMHSVHSINWDEEKGIFDNGYTPGIIISNTCDISTANSRAINKKNSLFAPVIPLSDFIVDLQRKGFGKSQIEEFITTLKNQEFTNLFYLPPKDTNNKEFIAFLDKLFWLPVNVLLSDSGELSLNNRYGSLSNYGYYLFLLKISIHLCRFPEEVERRESE